VSLVDLDPLATLLSEPAFRWLDQPNMALLTDDLRVIHRTEAELRDGLAAFAHLHGWHVTTEFVIPSWGRVDLIAVTAERTYVIEVKKAIIQARHTHDSRSSRSTGTPSNSSACMRGLGTSTRTST
jgi:hypothetical protein